MRAETACWIITALVILQHAQREPRVTRPHTGRRPLACSCASRTPACHPRLPFTRRSRVNDSAGDPAQVYRDRVHWSCWDITFQIFDIWSFDPDSLLFFFFIWLFDIVGKRFKNVPLDLPHYFSPVFTGAPGDHPRFLAANSQLISFSSTALT
jgi:hypothetical protein